MEPKLLCVKPPGALVSCWNGANNLPLIDINFQQVIGVRENVATCIRLLVLLRFLEWHTQNIQIKNRSVKTYEGKVDKPPLPG